MSRFAKPTRGSGFFKPKEYENALALLLEPKSIKKGVEHTYNGQTKIRDEVQVDITVFGDEDALNKGEPTEVLKGITVAHGMLAGALEELLQVEAPGVARVTMTDTRAGRGYVFRFDLKPDDEAKVENYYVKREQELAAAVEAAPDFD